MVIFCLEQILLFEVGDKVIYSYVTGSRGTFPIHATVIDVPEDSVRRQVWIEIDENVNSVVFEFIKKRIILVSVSNLRFCI